MNVAFLRCGHGWERKVIAQRLKPVHLATVGGTAEAVP